MKRIDDAKYCQECSQEGSSITIIRGVCHSYNERLREILSESNRNFEPIDLGCPSAILIKSGIPNLPIQISVRNFLAKKGQYNHPFKLTDVIHLPEFLCYPIAVFRSASTAEDRKVVLTEMKCNNINIVIIVSPNQNYRGFYVNDIRSIYPKDNIKAILLWTVEDNLLEYADKQKFLDWLGKQQSHSAEVTKLIKDTANIIQNM